MTETVASLWARTTVRTWPERYVLASFSPSLLPDVARTPRAEDGTYAALIVERDDLTLIAAEAAWRRCPAAARARAVEQPCRMITFDLGVDLDVAGYLAPALARLAEAGVPIIPVCTFRKDHLLVRERDLEAAVRALGELVAECRAKWMK